MTYHAKQVSRTRKRSRGEIVPEDLLDSRVKPVWEVVHNLNFAGRVKAVAWGLKE